MPRALGRAVAGVGFSDRSLEHGGGIIAFAENRLHDDHLKAELLLHGRVQISAQIACARLISVLGQQVDDRVILAAGLIVAR